MSEIIFPDTCFLKMHQEPSQPSFPLITYLDHTPKGALRLKALLQAPLTPGLPVGLSASPWPTRWPTRLAGLSTLKWAVNRGQSESHQCGLEQGGEGLAMSEQEGQRGSRSLWPGEGGVRAQVGTQVSMCGSFQRHHLPSQAKNKPYPWGICCYGNLSFAWC